MKQLHVGTDTNGWDSKTFEGGANSDTESEKVARTNGTYIDAQNMHIGDDSGGGGALRKIQGETLVNGPDMPGATTYICIGSVSVSGRRFEVWASSAPTVYPPLIRIEGTTMVMSDQLPYKWDKRIQLHASEDCDGGIVFDARSGGIPLHWPVKKIMDAYTAGSQLFFSGLDITAYQVNPTRPSNRARFMGFKDMGGGAGVKGGQRHYRIRYVNDNGDRTPDGPPLGPVMVPFTSNIVNVPGAGAQTPTTPVWPQADVAGVEAPPVDTIAVRGAYGVKLRFRVDNRANFESIEVVCEHFSTNEGVDAVAEITIVHRQAILPGEIQVYDIIDDGEEIDPIAQDDDAIRTYFIQEVNSVRYINYRVWYGGILLAKKDIQGSYIGDPGDRFVPFTKNLGIKGHSDPVNHCYFRRFQSGERHGFGVVYWDEGGGESFVDVVESVVTFPNRRDEKTGDSLALSDAPCYAANNNVPVTVSPTFEVFDHDNATGKTQTGQVFNVMANGRRKYGGQAFVGEAAVPVSSPPPGITEEFGPYGNNNDGVFLDEPGGYTYIKSGYTKPFRPVRPDDYKFGLDYKVNTAAYYDSQLTHPNNNYDPKVNNVDHHSMGIALRGVDEQPIGTQGFSVVATPPAKRVVVQALAKWVLEGQTPTPTFVDYGNTLIVSEPESAMPPPATKAVFKLHICIPDYNAGQLGQEEWEGILNSPSLHGIQLVSPLGFTTEQYGSVLRVEGNGAQPSTVGDTNRGSRSSLADVLSTARVLWDDGRMNGVLDTSSGYIPSSPLGARTSFVGAGSWRNTPGALPWGTDPKAILGFSTATEKVHESGLKSIILGMDDAVYNTPSIGDPIATTFYGAKSFHEPWYVVNIVQDGVQPEEKGGYQWLNHYRAWKARVGRISSDPTQLFDLVDERREDVYTTVIGEERYVYVSTSAGVRPYLFTGNLTPVQIQNIQIAIAFDGSYITPNGVTVYGLYNVDINGELTSVRITYPANTEEGSSVEVRYDKSIPEKIYGDMITSPSIATLVDAKANANWNGFYVEASGSVGPRPEIISQINGAGPGWINVWTWPLFQATSNQVLHTNGLPIPHPAYKYNDRYMVPFGGTYMDPGSRYYGLGGDVVGDTIPGLNASQLAVNQLSTGMIDSIRQWKIIFDCEVRAPIYLAQFNNAQGGLRSYPQINYVQKPYNFRDSYGLDLNGVFPGYGNEYPFSVPGGWDYGGFSSSQVPIPAYFAKVYNRYFRRPLFGYQEKEDQCSLLIWSNKDTPLLQDSPGLKTFPTNNSEFVDNDRGKIQRLYSNSPGSLVIVCERGWFEALLEKGIAYSADGIEFSMFAQDKAVGQIVPRSKNIGMPGETWMTAAEGAPTIGGVQYDALMWFDGMTHHRLIGNTVSDMAIGIFRKALKAAYTNNPGPIPVCAVFDQGQNELITNLGNRTLVFGPTAWQGGFDYVYNSMVYNKGELWGMKNLSSFRLKMGTQIQGKSVKSWVKVASAPFPGERMEWMRVKSNSIRKPSRIEFYDENNVMVSWMDQATFGQFYIKKETDWEQFVPRNNTNVDPDKKRLQGRVAYYKIFFNEEGDDKIIHSAVQVKALK